MHLLHVIGLYENEPQENTDYRTMRHTNRRSEHGRTNNAKREEETCFEEKALFRPLRRYSHTKERAVMNTTNAPAVFHVPERQTTVIDARLLAVHYVGCPVLASQRRCDRDLRTLRTRRRLTMFSVV